MNVFLLFMAILGLGGCNMANGQETTVQEVVDTHYTNEAGVIHAYPDDQQSEYLSESIGLYMEFLVQTNDRRGFSEQVAILQEQFLVEKNGQLFIPWRLYEKATVNALIDDVRVAAALQQAASSFNEPAYAGLAGRILSSIQDRQHRKGIMTDYFDWSYGLAGNRLTLSYLIADLAVREQSFNMLDTKKDGLFFPEYYDFDQQIYVESEEVHMIDQLLIATNRFDQGLASPEFDRWLASEWENRGLIYGRYERASGEPAVDYESLAVYYYLWAYWERTGDVLFAGQAVERAKIVAGDELPGELHFFDYIHHEMMKAAQ